MEILLVYLYIGFEIITEWNLDFWWFIFTKSLSLKQPLNLTLIKWPFKFYVTRKMLQVTTWNASLTLRFSKIWLEANMFKLIGSKTIKLTWLLGTYGDEKFDPQTLEQKIGESSKE